MTSYAAEIDTMAQKTTAGPPTEKQVDRLYSLIDGINVAMFTTRRKDGSLVSRPMATQKRTKGADLWFVTDIHSHKLDELRNDPHVNVPSTQYCFTTNNKIDIILTIPNL